MRFHRLKIFGAIGAGLLVLVVVLYIYRLYRSEPAVVDTSDVSFPIATSTNTASRGEIRVTSQSGESILMNNFVENGVTAEDQANPGNYYLAGATSNCNDSGECSTVGETTDFNILYFSEQGSFAIYLAREPLGEVRRAAETYLMGKLGISQSAMCDLRYTLGTTVYVNEIYGSMDNLKFSFCPGAVTLP